jgi:hypothetical protein
MFKKFKSFKNSKFSKMLDFQIFNIFKNQNFKTFGRLSSKFEVAEFGIRSNTPLRENGCLAGSVYGVHGG